MICPALPRAAVAKTHRFPSAPVSSSGDGKPGESFRHPNALVEPGATIGRGTRVWAFTHIVNGAVIGEDCNICDHTFIEGRVRVGNRVTIKCGVFLWDGLTVEDDVFIGPGAIFTNDIRPRSRRHMAVPLKTLLKEGCSVGANCTTLPNLVIGRWAMIGAGSVVTRDVPDYALMVGSPARFRAWICRCGEKLSSARGRFLVCGCGRSYRQTGKNEVREFAANGILSGRSANQNDSDARTAIMKNNGHSSDNGR